MYKRELNSIARDYQRLNPLYQAVVAYSFFTSLPTQQKLSLILGVNGKCLEEVAENHLKNLVAPPELIRGYNNRKQVPDLARTSLKTQKAKTKRYRRKK